MRVTSYPHVWTNQQVSDARRRCDCRNRDGYQTCLQVWTYVRPLRAARAAASDGVGRCWWGGAGQVRLPGGEEGCKWPHHAGWRERRRLGHFTLAAPNRSRSIIRRLEAHDPTPSHVEKHISASLPVRCIQISPHQTLLVKRVVT